jgi:hypothetical protein
MNRDHETALGKLMGDLDERLGRCEDTDLEIKNELSKITTLLESMIKQQWINLSSAGTGGLDLHGSISGSRSGNQRNEEELSEAVDRGALERLVDKHALLLATIEELARQRDQLLQDIELNRYAGSVGSPLPDSRRSDERINDLLLQVSNLTKTQQALQSSFGELKTQVSDILSSRVWKTLVAVGGILLRFMPGRRQ